MSWGLKTCSKAFQEGELCAIQKLSERSVQKKPKGTDHQRPSICPQCFVSCTFIVNCKCYQCAQAYYCRCGICMETVCCWCQHGAPSFLWFHTFHHFHNSCCPSRDVWPWQSITFTGRSLSKLVLPVLLGRSGWGTMGNPTGGHSWQDDVTWCDTMCCELSGFSRFSYQTG